MCIDQYLHVYLSTTCVCVSGAGDENKMSDPWNWRYYRWLWAAGCGWWQWSPCPQQVQQVIVTSKRLCSPLVWVSMKSGKDKWLSYSTLINTAPLLSCTVRGDRKVHFVWCLNVHSGDGILIPMWHSWHCIDQTTDPALQWVSCSSSCLPVSVNKK